MAQGISLAAMLLPVGILAAIKYYQAGNVDIRFAALLAVGFLVGGLIGAMFAQPASDELLRKVFGIFLLIIAVEMLFF